MILEVRGVIFRGRGLISEPWGLSFLKNCSGWILLVVLGPLLARILTALGLIWEALGVMFGALGVIFLGLGSLF